MTGLSATLQRSGTTRRSESRIAAFWSYLGSFGDDFFSEDDDLGAEDGTAQQR